LRSIPPRHEMVSELNHIKDSVKFVWLGQNAQMEMQCQKKKFSLNQVAKEIADIFFNSERKIKLRLSKKRVNGIWKKRLSRK
jgi:hypothetical protein